MPFEIEVLAMIVLKSFAQLQDDEINDIYSRLDFDNSNLIPSVVYSWSNNNDGAEFAYGDKWVVGLLQPFEWKEFWALNSKHPLGSTDIETIYNMIKHRSRQRVIHGITPLSLQEIGHAEKEEPSSSNYIYNTKDLTELDGHEYASIRRELRGALSDVSISIWPIEDLDKEWNLIKKLHKRWLSTMANPSSSQVYELEATKKLLHFFKLYLPRSNDLIAVALIKDHELVGLSISEIYKQGSINHYFKTINSYKGIGTYLFWATCKYLFEHDIKDFNFQEDLGIVGLRLFKSKMKPCRIVEQVSLNLDSTTSNACFD